MISALIALRAAIDLWAVQPFPLRALVIGLATRRAAGSMILP
jgi:hypothetical protein